MLLNLANRCNQFSRNFAVTFPSLLSPEIVTGTAARPDLLVVDGMNNLFIIELTVGYESNTEPRVTRKVKKYEYVLDS